MLSAMKVYPILFFSVLIHLTSCTLKSHTQTGNHADSDKFISAADTVDQFGDNIMVIYQDQKNNYWLGSWEDGLYKYDGQSIIHYTTKDGLPDNRVEEIKEDKNGNIYINTRKGLCRFNDERFSKFILTINLENDWKLSSDDLWFNCFEPSGYVYRLEANQLYRLKTPTTKIGEDYVAKHPNYSIPYDIYCNYKDSKGNIWFGTAALGAFRYNGKSFDWILETDLTELHNGPSNGVRSIIEDLDGYFWFNADYRYKILNDLKLKGSFYERQKSIGSLDGKKNGILNEYLSVTKDKENNLWFATYQNGVWKYDGKNIEHYPIQENGVDIHLFYIYTDNYGVIWLGTHKNGVWKFNGKSFEKFTNGKK
jgi:ligand-binding sensor domain-containing protein